MSKDVKRMSLEEAESFTSDKVTSAIKRYRNSRAYGPDSISIFHLKNLGPLATEHLTSLYNYSLKSWPTRGGTVMQQTTPVNRDHLYPDSLLSVSVGFLPRSVRSG